MLDRRFSRALRFFASALALTGCGYAADGDAFLGGSAGPGASNGSGSEGGTLTAGVWDDNRNFDLYSAYVADHLSQGVGSPNYGAQDRITITVTGEGGVPVGGAIVHVADAVKQRFSAPTGSDGRALFFPGRDAGSAEGLTITVDPPAGQQGASAVVPLPKAGESVTIPLPGVTPALPQALDLAFVVDTTGSMGDEIGYLTAEMQGISDHVSADFPGVSVHYALIVYRDHGDDYVTRKFDFTDSLQAFKLSLGAQSADGGGDTPEAMDEAMALVPTLGWRNGNTARLAFLVADAPPHPEVESQYLVAVDLLRPIGIRLYPVGASGVDGEAEYLMRAGAEATLGRYLFLTDDSGVGDPHATPHIPCFQVEKLSVSVHRMIASELSGERVPAKDADVIREVGSPKDGICTLQGGKQAFL